ncbi:MAG: DUF1294 domain-containing protein [Bacteroidaceae bacterium]|jgi:uncharacterized membrane protein YsdA (DUF1294 family)|nr:DUF1294 domain-containing protein [Bacteroidaceae bacterium]
MWKYFVIFILVMSVITFFVFGWDKWKAKNDKWRTPESTLFLLAIFGGSVGALLGMQVWRHKTQHWSFRLGIPIILILQAAGLVWYFFFSK